jgi:apolipoprotein N-acyltransferase
LLLAISSGLLFWLAWPVKPFAPLLFLAFVPILLLDQELNKEQDPKAGRKFFAYAYLALLIWNVTTTWWIVNATIIGGIFAMLVNALLMYLPLWAFRYTRQRASEAWGYFGFVLYWMTFEHIHLSWDLSWPWLTLGNAFAMFPEWIQWYEWTGVFGGTLWVLLGNLAFYLALFRSGALQRGFIPWRSLTYTVLWILLPIAFSYYRYVTYEEKGALHEMVVLQPNIDPYAEKFEEGERFIPYEEQVRMFIRMSEQQLRDQTDFLLWPETAIDRVFLEEELQDEELIREIKAFRDSYENLSILTGITSYSVYREDIPATARYREDIGYYDLFNAGMFISDVGTDTVYHKSKLVPGVEIIPYPQFFNFLSETLFDLGGTAGGLGRQQERTVLYNGEGVGAAPSICYESVYGDFMSQFVLNGANYIFIITNDGWWGDTPGHRQHFHYACLRAIETRRSIARCANTGISGFFNQRGEILQRSTYWEPAVIRGQIRANDTLTFYARYGDYLGRTAAWMAVFVFLAAFVKNKLLRR